MRCWLLALLALLTAVGAESASPKKVICYYGTWASYRPGKGKFELKNIQPQLCTHVIYSFVGIAADGGIKVLDKQNDITNGGFKNFNKAMKKNGSTKTLVAIGGWSEGSETYSKVFNDPKKRATFVKNALKFVKDHGFDGFDVDWEYPAERGGLPSDKKVFVSLLKELSSAFEKDKLLLSAAVGVAQNLVSTSYDVPALSKYLDFINMMTYDIHGSWESVTGHNAPLYPRSDDSAPSQNVNASIQNWIKNGASPGKLVLGIGMYGRSFTLKKEGTTGIGAEASGPGKKGPYTQEAGMLGYNEICEMVKKGGWKVEWNDEQKVPYASNKNQWVGYDDVRSIKLKAEYARDMGLGGAMIWSIDTDDFLGECHSTKFPLLTAINEVLRGGKKRQVAG